MKLTDQYRPTSIDDIVGQHEATDVLSAYLADPYPECWLLEAGPGVGKTATMLCMIQALAGDDRWPGYQVSNAAELGIDDAKSIMKWLSCTMCCPDRPHHHVWGIEEFEVLSPQLRVYLKTAFDPCCLPDHAVVIATANDPQALGAPLLQRFKRLQFTSDETFRDGYNGNIRRIWHEHMNGQNMPIAWEEWGYDQGSESYSMRLALDKLQMYLLRHAHNSKTPAQRRQEADAHVERIGL